MALEEDPQGRPYLMIGRRIKGLREAKGLSRQTIATRLRVDITSLAGWEAGKRLPREHHRLALARALGTEINTLFTDRIDEQASSTAVTLVEAVDTLPGVLLDLTRAARRVRALRLAAPHMTPAYIQVPWRTLISERLRSGATTVERVEIFYSLRRLQEVLSNILRYDGCRYYVKAYCAGLKEIPPALGGYFFDEDDFLLDSFVSVTPGYHHSTIRLSGSPFQQFFRQYWDEAWRGGTQLNPQGAHDLSEIRETALKLGLSYDAWDTFVAGARGLQVGDGAPPLI